MADEQKRTGKCPECNVEEEIGFGLAGGGYGLYGYCPNCHRILWKDQEDEEWQTMH